jgi:hypothetical protein
VREIVLFRLFLFFSFFGEERQDSFIADDEGAVERVVLTLMTIWCRTEEEEEDERRGAVEILGMISW